MDTMTMGRLVRGLQTTPMQTRSTSQIALFDDPKHIEIAKRAAAAMRKQYPFDEASTTVMDFACGTGLISRELAPYAKSIVGVDITQALVDRYNESVSNQGIAPEEMRAVCIELKGEEGELDGLKFDVITCSVSYHHFESIENITKMLAFFLKPGGALLVVDILNTDDELQASGSNGAPTSNLFPQEYHHIVAHTSGFKEGQLRAVFEGAGLTSFELNKATEAKFSVHGQDATLFIAKGTKPLSKK